LSRRAAFLKRIPFLDRGYAAQASFSFGATPEYLLGHYYLQAPLSQLVCEIMAPPPGATVLDMAAAPGGKTTYLAEMVGEGGVVVALDNDATRLAAVRNNAERLGIANILCVKKDARFAFDLGKKFDFVLLDAPCSGNFCSEEQWFGRRTMTDIKLNARVQMELLKAAYQCLAPGGVLVYSTCSLEPEEDECVIDAFLKRYPDMTVEPLDGLRDGARDIDGEDASAPLGDSGTTSWDGKPLDPRVAGTRRFWPHKTGFEGFYIARLRKAKKDA
jgi:NOL1/NOP2/sun family putative RNA methylase